MPTRQDHARWITHIAKARVPISGASDHGVSEAFYLDDPEGNGIEVYNDRPRERWNWENGLVTMQTKQLDIEAILREIDPASATYPAAPEGLRIGHVHLRVGSVEKRRGILSQRARPRPHPPPRRRNLHVVGRLSSSRRRQCLA